MELNKLKEEMTKSFEMEKRKLTTSQNQSQLQRENVIITVT